MEDRSNMADGRCVALNLNHGYSVAKFMRTTMLQIFMLPSFCRQQWIRSSCCQVSADNNTSDLHVAKLLRTTIQRSSCRQVSADNNAADLHIAKFLRTTMHQVDHHVSSVLFVVGLPTSRRVQFGLCKCQVVASIVAKDGRSGTEAGSVAGCCSRLPCSSRLLPSLQFTL